jgi:aminopeptidase-like protein
MDQQSESGLYHFLTELFPICRSLTGHGVRETLARIGNHIPIEIYEVKSGTAVFDWTVPNEWNIDEAYVENEAGQRVIDFADHNLHVVGYSVPIEAVITLEELETRLHSIPDQPDAIPYITSYYKEYWGFCIAHSARKKLKPGKYKVKIAATLKPGSLTYGELIIPGKSDREIFLSTYVCHPSMANNELSGPVVVTWLAKWLRERSCHYTYRIVFVPETIGSLVYLSRNLESLRRNVIAGFVLSCVGDERSWSIVESRYAGTHADRLLHAGFAAHNIKPKVFSYLDRGSDERQYGAPGVDLPMVTFCRSKFGDFPEYHTSLDDLTLVTETGLKGSFELMKSVIQLAEENRIYRVKTLGEPQLGKRGMYPTMSTVNSINEIRALRNIIAYADGTNDLQRISHLTGESEDLVKTILGKLVASGLVEEL